MAELKNLISNTPVVIVLDSVSPYCHKLASFFDENFNVPSDRVAKSYTDKGDGGAEIGRQSKAESKSFLPLSGNGQQEVELPHVYIGGQFIYGGEDFKQLRKGKLRNELIKAGALDLPKKEKVEAMIKENDMVVFLNEFSPYSFSTKDIMQEVSPKGKEVKFIYVDKATDFKELEVTALYLANAENLPVVFAGGKFIGDGKQIEEMNKDFTLLDALAESGFVRKPAHEVLAQQKKDYGIYIVGNDFSPYCIEARAVFENIPVAAGNILINDAPSELNEDLLNAAMRDAGTKNAPFIYIAGEHMPTKEFNRLQKEGKLQDYLNEKGVL